MMFVLASLSSPRTSVLYRLFRDIVVYVGVCRSFVGLFNLPIDSAKHVGYGAEFYS
jgi:hypothetical protein